MEKAAVKLNDAIEKAEKLSFEEQGILLELLKNRHIDRRRTQIAVNAKKTLRQYKAGSTKTGTVKDLKKDLDNG